MLVDRPGEYTLSTSISSPSMLIVTLKELPNFYACLGLRARCFLMYVAHLGRRGIGVTRSNRGDDGGRPPSLIHGS